MLLLLIDAHAILHRAYHALPPLTNKDGVQTNAVYGFVSMLLRLLTELKPTHLAVAFDMPGPTFRQKIWTQYQEKRPEVSSNLIEQFPLTHELLDHLSIQHYQCEGYEADDVLGTLVKQVSRRKKQGNEKISLDSRFQILDSPMEVVIVTGDRDLLQLVNDHVKVLVPVKGFGQTKTYDRAKMFGEFGITPEQWVDVKALKGDSSDNYPGVRGIGPKTAQELVAKFGNLENVYKSLGTLGNLGKKLAEGAEDAGLSKKLATIVTDVPGVKLQLDKVAVAEINWEQGAKYMREKLGFRSIADKIEKRLHGLVTDDTDKIAKVLPGEQLGLI